MAGTNYFAPGSGKPCVWYRTNVYEERREVKRRQDQDGNWYEDVEHRWHHIAKDERFVDFYLQDGTSKVFINGNRGGCRIHGTRNLEEHRFSIFLLLVLLK